MYREKFCEIFEIDKLKYETPGRDWDEEGLCSYYIEECDPSFEDSLFFELLDLSEDLEIDIDLNVKPLDIPHQLRNILPERVCKAFIDKYNSLEDKKSFKEEVKDYLNTYINDVVNVEC